MGQRAVLLQYLQGDNFQRPLMGRRQMHLGGAALVMGLQEPART